MCEPDIHDDPAARCIRLVTEGVAAFRRACWAALPELAATIGTQVTTLHRQCEALQVWAGVEYGGRPRLWNEYTKPMPEIVFRRGAEQQAEHTRVMSNNTSLPDPAELMATQRAKAEDAWAAIESEVVALVAENATRLGDAELKEPAEDDECEECADTGNCPDCEGGGVDPDGRKCRSCSGSGACPDAKCGADSGESR